LTDPGLAGTRSAFVVGLGYCVYDILAIVPGLPDLDSVHFAHLADLVFDGGGQVGTALTALSRLGVRTGYVGLLGDDPAGHWLTRKFQGENVDTARLQLSSEIGTNVCLVLVDQATAARSILCHQRVRPGDLMLADEDRAYIQSADVLHLDGQFMPAAVQAARWAKEAGTKICFDGNHPRPGLDELLPLVDWLVVAESFPMAQTGLPDLSAAAHGLLSLGAELVVVTQGEMGCRAWTGEEAIRAPGYRIHPVDTTGAGDAFHGAFIYGMLQGWALPRVLRFSNAFAAMNCRTLGGRRGLPALSDVDRFLTT